LGSAVGGLLEERGRVAQLAGVLQRVPAADERLFQNLVGLRFRIELHGLGGRRLGLVEVAAART
jgi:hypothetical protein